MEEKDHILNILKQVKKALQKKDNVTIKNLSDHLIHTSSIHQDSDIIALAVIIYSLSKIIERKSYKEFKNYDRFYKDYTESFSKLIKELERKDIDKFRNEIQKIRSSIQNLTGDLKANINDVFRKAKINKASRIYEHGISMEKTAKILGITIWELAEYAGNSKVTDFNITSTLPIKERIQIAEEIFK